MILFQKEPTKRQSVLYHYCFNKYFNNANTCKKEIAASHFFIFSRLEKECKKTYLECCLIRNYHETYNARIHM